MKKPLFFLLIFILLYSIFVFKVKLFIKEYSEIIVASAFFFSFFTGFFIARQSSRYSQILEIISATDGEFSFLYRVSGLIPRIQPKVREIIRAHYQKIKESKNWAHHVLNPSVTITMLTKTFGSVTIEESSPPPISAAFTNIWGALQHLQELRKKTILFYHQKMLPFQWALIYVSAFLTVFSLNLLPSDSILMDILKIIFGTIVIIAVILLKQLDDLTIFGKDFAEKTAHDIFRILDEKDIEELTKIKKIE